MANYNDNLNVTYEVIQRDNVGDVFTHTDGHRYKVTKKTRTTIAVTRQYFFNDWLDWFSQRLGVS